MIKIYNRKTKGSETDSVKRAILYLLLGNCDRCVLAMLLSCFANGACQCGRAGGQAERPGNSCFFLSCFWRAAITKGCGGTGAFNCWYCGDGDTLIVSVRDKI